MKALVCEMCGSNDLIRQNGLYVCQNCNTQYSPEDAKKMIVELNATVKIDNKDTLNNLCTLLRNETNPGEAKKYADRILLENPDYPEARFYHKYHDYLISPFVISEELEDALKIINEIDDCAKQLKLISGIWSTLDNEYERILNNARTEILSEDFIIPITQEMLTTYKIITKTMAEGIKKYWENDTIIIKYTDFCNAKLQHHDYVLKEAYADKKRKDRKGWFGRFIMKLIAYICIAGICLFVFIILLIIASIFGAGK